MIPGRRIRFGALDAQQVVTYITTVYAFRPAAMFEKTGGKKPLNKMATNRLCAAFRTERLYEVVGAGIDGDQTPNFLRVFIAGDQNQGRISMGVPLGTNRHISSISVLVTAIQPLVQSK